MDLMTTGKATTQSVSVDRPHIRLLHTSDVHIGDDINAARRLEGLTAVVNVAIERRVDALLIVGDFFDSARVKSPEVDEAIAQLQRLDIPTIVTVGNHDCLSEPSIYDRADMLTAGSHVHFLDDPDGRHMHFDELKLSVWARAMLDHHPGHNPLAGFERNGNGHWHVALAHGHYVPDDESNYRSSPIWEREIADMGCDYLALGHWHRFLDVSANGVPAFYCGSPSEAGGSFSSGNLVALHPEDGVSVERISLGIDA